MNTEKLMPLLLAGLLGIGCLLILLPFLPAMLWAAILVFATWPFYRRACQYLPRQIVALLITTAIAVLVLLPLLHIAARAGVAMHHWQAILHRAITGGDTQNGDLAPPQSMLKLPVIGPILGDLWTSSAVDLGQVGDATRPLVTEFAHTGVKFVLALTRGLVGVMVALFIAFFFYVSGERLAGACSLILSRILDETRSRHFMKLVGDTVRGVVFGILGTALMQGALYALGFAVAHAPQALLLATIAGFFSIIPAGAIIVYVPVCLFLAAKGHLLAGILLAIYCFAVVGGADSFVRPWLISRGASLPYLVTLLGVLGGAIAFGALGIFLGPVLLALGLAAAEEFAGLPRGAWRAPE
ncbi:MAG: hypothetical protein B7Z78_09825 [Rhodospirillales bacterium 20-60-12]|nr:MAG: hypothetical protein B7Z78_09825 [Rhodospirillales bacterium 20-60-12]HQT68465.1 AI-2E family transporter [Acetobacteraceae bacterium]HQU02885.1 AI-2E family transporter [Acetobacteraceae bacterium]